MGIATDAPIGLDDDMLAIVHTWNHCSNALRAIFAEKSQKRPTLLEYLICAHLVGGEGDILLDDALDHSTHIVIEPVDPYAPYPMWVGYEHVRRAVVLIGSDYQERILIPIHDSPRDVVFRQAAQRVYGVLLGPLDGIGVSDYLRASSASRGRSCCVSAVLVVCCI